MVTRLLVIALVCFSVYGFPNPTYTSDRTLPIINNTIFADERFEGEIFENVDFFSNTELNPRNTDSPYRLPTTTKPVHYKILWTIDFERSQPSQAGTVEIMLHATKSDVNEIVIHSDELTLTRVQLTRGTDTVLTTYEEDKSYQFLKVRLNSEYLAFNAENPIIYTLTIDFGAPLRDDMYGIYKNWYRNSPDENVRWMASTQFQSTAARWAFPCYDEPSFKATFDVTIRRQPTYKSWSCTRLKETKEVVTGFQDDIYHTTPIMSTYLLAIIVADYESIKVENTEGDMAYEVIARPGAIRNGQGDYAFTAGQALLAEMSSHTGIDFYAQHPQLKMTHAAIPDFGAGAMENWGLLTYRYIVNDLFQFARSGLIKYTRMLNILSFLGNETEYTPWVAAITGFNWLRQRLAGDTTIDTLNELNELIIRWASKVMSLLTYYPTAGESFMTSYFRYQLAPLMCNLGEPDCIEAARTQYQNLRVNNIPVPVDSRHWVYCNGLRYGNAQDFDFLWNKFMTSNVYTEKVLILQNIGCTKDADSLRKFMYAIVQDDYTIRRHDYSTAFSSAVNGNEENTEVAFAFIRDNLDLVANKFGGSVATPMSYVTARLRSRERIYEFISWAITNRIALGSAYNSVINGAESTRNSILWAENVQDDINNYLRNAPDPITTSTSAPTSTITDNLETTTITETPGTDGPETTDEVETPGTTVQQPIITEPVTPTFPTTPDIATKNDIALLLMIVTMIANIVL